MTLKEKINYMLEQYSMTKDNPTVLRELRRLAALTAEVVEWVENNDPTDFTEQLNEVNARLDEIEAIVKSLNLDTINADIAALKVSVAEAQANANSAKTSAESALTASENAVSDVAALEASVNEFKGTVNSQIETITASVNEATTKAESAGSKADEAVTASNEAKTVAGAAGTKADAAKTAADSAKTTADAAKAAAEQASTDVQEMQLALEGKQDALTFDSSPTSGSDNPVTSDGIYKAIQAGSGTITLDDTVTPNSHNGVKSSGIYTAIQAVQTDLDGQKDLISANTDAISAANTKIVSLEENKQTVAGELATLSGDVAALDADKMNKMDVDNVPTASSTNLVESGGVYSSIASLSDAIDETKIEVNNKQDVLTFDDYPEPKSSNPVKSSGVYSKFQTLQDDVNSRMYKMTTENNGNSVNIQSYVMPSMNSAPSNPGSLITALGVWNAIQNALSGGSGISNIELKNVDVNNATANLYTIVIELPDNFIPLSVYFKHTFNSVTYFFDVPIIMVPSNPLKLWSNENELYSTSKAIYFGMVKSENHITLFMYNANPIKVFKMSPGNGYWEQESMIELSTVTSDVFHVTGLSY